jgi:CelD/BcsL family acetyltransferase involved in cellulose biosynthesis
MPSLGTLAAATRPREADLTLLVGEQLAGVAPEWDALADETGAPPFLRPRWFAAWSAAFHPRGLELITVRSQGRLVGVLPLLGRGRVLRGAANDHTPMFGAVAATARVTQMLAEALVERSRSIDIPCVDPGSPVADALRDAASAAGHSVIDLHEVHQPYVNLDGTWPEFEKSLPRNVRREGARLRRRLDELGAVSFHYDDGGDRLDEALAEGFAIEGSGWKSADGTAIASSRTTESFYRAVAEWASERGWLRLAFLRVDGRAAAFDLCIEADGVIYALKGGFDPHFRKYGPGQLLIRETLMHAFERGAARYEFLGTADSYKLAWTDAAHERISFRSYPPTIAGSARLFAERSGRPLAKRVLQAVREPRVALRQAPSRVHGTH